MAGRSTRVAFVAVVALCLAGSASSGQDRVQDEILDELKSQLDAQAAEIRELHARLDRQQAIFEPDFGADEPGCGATPDLRRVPIVVEEDWEPTCASSSRPESRTIKYYADYDKGFLIRPFNAEKLPFELKVNGWIQFRHHAFAREVDSWTDNAGITRPVRNRNAFDVERGRLVFSGHALDPHLTYFLQLDGDTDGGTSVDFFDYWWAWECSDRFKIQLGKRKVPGSRQWLLGARNTRLIDRPMANDFFRPDRTVGIFGVGRIGENGHYEVMAGNGYSTSVLPNSLTDNRFTFAATNYWDPWGDFGPRIVDFSSSNQPLVRLGHSFVYSPTSSDVDELPIGEADFLRLTDGTRLNAPNALAPDTLVDDFDVYLYGIDVAFKWRGWSVDAEVFLRWIEQLRGEGVLPVTDLFQRGFYIEGGRFLIAERLDVNARYSQINGFFGNAAEYAAGFNWYPLETPRFKISFDVTSLDSSPLQNTTSDILVGDDGTLFRTQVQAEF